jgi:hypothetical protein
MFLCLVRLLPACFLLLLEFCAPTYGHSVIHALQLRPGNNDRPTLTPPQVSGVSLAPVPEAELCYELGAGARIRGGAAGSQQPQHEPQGGVRMLKKPGPLRPAMPPTSLPDATLMGGRGGGMEAGGQGGSNGGGGEPLQLRAEGKRLQQRPVIVPPTEMESNAMYFHEINDSDSLWYVAMPTTRCPCSITHAPKHPACIVQPCSITSGIHAARMRPSIQPALCSHAV